MNMHLICFLLVGLLQQNLLVLAELSITTIAGQSGEIGADGDGGSAIHAHFSAPSGIAMDAAGNTYISDKYNFKIRKIEKATGIISTYAGTGEQGALGDGGPAIAAQLDIPENIVIDTSNNVLYMCEQRQNKIRMIRDGGSMISTYAGDGTQGSSGDGGPASSAQLNDPTGVAIDGIGTLYIADSRNNKIRTVNRAGIIATFAGTGEEGRSGDGGMATAAQLDGPVDVAVDSSGNVYIVETDNQKIRMVTTSGIISTFAGSGATGASGDGGLAVNAQLNNPQAIALDLQGNLYIADFGSNTIRMVMRSTGIITTIAGTGEPGSSGDGGPAIQAELRYPTSLAIVKETGDLLVADSWNNKIRVISEHINFPTLQPSIPFPSSRPTTSPSRPSPSPTISPTISLSPSNSPSFVQLATTTIVHCSQMVYSVADTPTFRHNFTTALDKCFDKVATVSSVSFQTIAGFNAMQRKHWFRNLLLSNTDDTAMNVSYTLTSSVMTTDSLQSYLVGSSFIWLLSDNIHKTYPTFTAGVPHVTILQGMTTPPLPSYPSLSTPERSALGGSFYAIGFSFIVMGGIFLVGMIRGFKYCFRSTKDGTRIGQKEYELLGNSRGDDEMGLSDDMGLSESDDDHDRNDDRNDKLHKRNSSSRQYEQVSTSISL